MSDAPPPNDGVPIEVDPPTAAELDPQEPSSLPLELSYSLVLHYNKQTYPISVPSTDTLGDLKTTIWTLTSVLPVSQVLLGLTSTVDLPNDDATLLSSLALNSDPKAEPHPFSLQVKLPPQLPPSAATLTSSSGDAAAPALDPISAAIAGALRRALQDVRNVRKLKETAEKLKIDMMGTPRPGKGLCVLDLDYCILDTGLWKEDNFIAEHFARPFLREFLTAIAPYYDVVVWSQTSWRYLEQKLLELGMVGDEAPPGLNVVFVLDRTCMFSVTEEDKDGKQWRHEVKALGLIWAKFPGQYSKQNTIHLDDLGRNFYLQPQNGLRVHAYKDAMFNSTTDRELVFAARYLLGLSQVKDISAQNHKHWRKTTLPLPPGAADPLVTFGAGQAAQLTSPPSPTAAVGAAPAEDATMAEPPAAEEDSPPSDARDQPMTE